MPILFKLLLLAGVIGGSVYAAQRFDLIEKIPGQKAVNDTTQQIGGKVQGATGSVTDSVSTQTQQLGQRAGEVNQHVQQVLGTYIQPAPENSEDSDQNNQQSDSQTNQQQSDPEKQPIYERAFEYSRYMYCQQVVKDWETQQSRDEQSKTQQSHNQ